MERPSLQNSHDNPPSSPAQVGKRSTRRPSLFIFAVTIFLSAYLLFLVQPLMGRYVLPWFGGGAGVWTTCMLFFQMVLLVGYSYAHLLDRLLVIRQQVAVHAAVLLLSLLALPIIPDLSWRPDGVDAPAGHILLLLLVHVGAPFAVLASSAPLLGAWYRHAFPTGSPYRLYALSNAGSLLALLAYPFVIEPSLALRSQGLGWSWAYVAFVTVCAACGWHLVTRSEMQTSTATEAAAAHPEPLEIASGGGKAFMRWIALSATGSVMLLATTSQISQEVSVVPMLWILPLGLYLLTFILCFERDGWYDRRVFVPLLVLSVGAVIYAFSQSVFISYSTQLAIYAGTQFVCCMCCHGELARLRPDQLYLTRFYLALAVGGALGGVFAAIIAPSIFSGYWEYHLALVAVVGFVAYAVIQADRDQQSAWVKLPAWRRWWVPTTACLACVATAVPLLLHASMWNETTIESSRNFFGANRVIEGDAPSGPYRALFNGATSHGMQLLTPELQQTPTTYYTEYSGLGFALRQLRQIRASTGGAASSEGPLRIGIVGLGAGTIAALARPGDYLRFYEINPEVERLARKHFSFLVDSPAQVDVVLGDARITMANELERGKTQNFDVLVLDAFNSDSVPVHLLTAEAYQLYRRQLAPGGVLAFHTSNRHLALSPNIRELAENYGDRAVRIHSVDQYLSAAQLSTWVLTTGNASFLAAPALAVEATPWAPWERTRQSWTDDYSSLWAALRERGRERHNKWRNTPNQGRFVLDTAQVIDREQEHRIRDLSRAMYWDTKPQVPLFVLTTKSLQRKDGSIPAAGAAVSELRNSLGLDRLDPQLEILIFVARQQKQIEVWVGPSWPGPVRKLLESTLQRTMVESLQQRDLSSTLLRMTSTVDEMVRTLQGS